MVSVNPADKNPAAYPSHAEIDAFEASTFSPPDQIADFSKNYGNLSQHDFNAFSLEVTKEVASRIKRAVEQNDVENSFQEIDTWVHSQRHELALRANTANPEQYGKLRPSDMGNFGFTCMMEANPRYRESLGNIRRLFGEYLSKNLSELTQTKQKGNCLLNIQIISPQTLQKNRERVTELILSGKADFQTKVILDIIEGCILLQKTEFARHGLADAVDEQLEVDEKAFEESLKNVYFLYGQVITSSGQAAGSTIQSTYIMHVTPSNGRFALDSQRRSLVIIHPPALLFSNFDTELRSMWREAILCSRSEKQEVNRCVARFIHTYTNKMRSIHGTGWAVQILSKALYRHHNFRLVKYAPCVQIDVKALENPFGQDFESNYLHYHAKDPTSE